ncbi:MAG: hypothetical protein ABSA67_04030 [Candidatus Brocadiia bacterium]|jgi:hypothetical protein
MATKTKTFDCVEMKNRIQAQRLAEYEAHKAEFGSYIDFVNARLKKSTVWKELARKSEKG